VDEDDGTGGDGGDGCFLSYVCLFVCLFVQVGLEREEAKKRRERALCEFFFSILTPR